MENLKQNVKDISGIEQSAGLTQSIMTTININQDDEVDERNQTGSVLCTPLENPRGDSLRKNNFVNMSMQSAEVTDPDMEDSEFQSMIEDQDNSIQLKPDMQQE